MFLRGAQLLGLDVLVKSVPEGSLLVGIELKSNVPLAFSRLHEQRQPVVVRQKPRPDKAPALANWVRRTVEVHEGFRNFVFNIQGKRLTRYSGRAAPETRFLGTVHGVGVRLWREPAAGASRINDALGKLAHRNMLLIGGAPEKSRGHGQPERNLEDQLVECGRVPTV